MVEFRYGPVELYLVGFEGDRPDPAVIAALVEQLESGLVRLLDFVLISKSADGDITVTEIETEEFGLGSVELAELGLAGDEDVADLAELIEPGTSAALVTLELLYARKLAERVAASGAVVLSSERIPAPIVNAILDAAEDEGEQS
ncbi:DUF6325 family protein [Microbacterium sp. RU33B]|uniref:DUF6325 family protein n=1 Tax=Microbacterium sp. RU33B TaxID=1907390 RepID=UPI000963F241|nr:DUF6325 family protein [Microbacterium sp. RU33B]SIT86293.1 hypothetical protein SAMN05880545_2495 [Microbacterium sp. RU33B]